MQVDSPQQGSGPDETTLCVCHFWNQLGGTLFQYEADHQIRLFWACLEVLWCVLRSVSACAGPGPPGRSYKVVHSGSCLC